MKTLELNQVIKVGKYECRVKTYKTLCDYFLDSNYVVRNDEIIKQFLPIDEFKKKFTNAKMGYFPEFETLEQLTKVVEYLKSFEKPEFKRGDRIIVWNENGKKGERIFFEYVEGNKKPFMCINGANEDHYKTKKPFSTAMWEFAEPIPQPKQITKDEIKKAFDCEDFEIID